MSEELLVDVNEFETRVALVRHSKLQEVHLERSGMYSLTGNLYKGRVTRVVPAMQAAFVDIGMARPGFLHVRDLHGLRYEDPGVALDVRSYLHAGQELIVQVVKDPINTKGPRLSTNIAVPARYVVLLPEDHHIGVSQRIEDDEQREQLRTWVADGRESSPRDTAISCAPRPSLPRKNRSTRTSSFSIGSGAKSPSDRERQRPVISSSRSYRSIRGSCATWSDPASR